jgi:hypothetical protein
MDVEKINDCINIPPPSHLLDLTQLPAWTLHYKRMVPLLTNENYAIGNTLAYIVKERKWFFIHTLPQLSCKSQII